VVILIIVEHNKLETRKRQMAKTEYHKIRDMIKPPRIAPAEILSDGIYMHRPRAIPTVSVRNAAGIYVEPLDKEYGYNIRTVKVVDPDGEILFEMTMHAAHYEKED
tara:strand:+ start:6502 stop:6819 length:318 start_codon:yes stop_codon:yes gene_type:complete